MLGLVKSHPLARYLRARRLERGLTQDDLARAIGLNRVAIALYETERRVVPLSAIPALAAILQVDSARLVSLRDGVARAGVTCVAQRAPLRPVDCPLNDLSRIHSLRELHEDVRTSLGEGSYADLEHSFLRQTRWELALGFLALNDGATPIWTSPQEAGSRILIVGEDKRSYEGHLLRLAVSWNRNGEKMVFFPQVPLLVPRIEKRYRVDYLVVHLGPRAPAANIIVELDGRRHDRQQSQDDLRAEDLRLPLLRFDNSAVGTADFFPHLVHSIREKAAAARISSSEFGRFIRSRRARYDSSPV